MILFLLATLHFIVGGVSLHSPQLSQEKEDALGFDTLSFFKFTSQHANSFVYQNARALHLYGEKHRGEGDDDGDSNKAGIILLWVFVFILLIGGIVMCCFGWCCCDCCNCACCPGVKNKRERERKKKEESMKEVWSSKEWYWADRWKLDSDIIFKD